MSKSRVEQLKERGISPPLTVKEFIKILLGVDPEAWVCFTHEGIVPPEPLKQDNMYEMDFNGQPTLRLDVTGVYDESIISIHERDADQTTDYCDEEFTD